jgi:hypothetical protein
VRSELGDGLDVGGRRGEVSKALFGACVGATRRGSCRIRWDIWPSRLLQLAMIVSLIQGCMLDFGNGCLRFQWGFITMDALSE